MVNNEGVLGDYVKVQGGYAYKSSDFKGEQACKVIKIKNVRFGYVDYSDTAYICEELADKTKNWMTREGDVLISMTGSGPNAPQSLVGRVARVWSNEEPVWINQRVGRLVLKSNDNPIDMDFVYYLLSQKTSQDFLVSNSSGSANQANISGKTIELLPFPKVTFEESKQISSILKALDEKILLNNQINQTLEQMAQTLFKSWFVDYDPVIDNALDAGSSIPEVFEARVERRKAVRESADFKALPDDVRGLFPSEFEESELGWVPKGWEVLSLKELIDVKHGYAFKGEFFSDQPTKDVLLTPGNVKIGGGFKSDKFKYYKGDLVPEYVFSAGDVYVNMTDLSKASDSLGFPAVVPVSDEVVFLHNQRLGKVLFKDHPSAQKEFLYQVLCSSAYRYTVLGSSTGTTVKHTAPKKILAHQLVCSSEGKPEKVFNSVVSNWSEKIQKNAREITMLEKLRDTLLPKLISGELRLDSPEVEKVKVLVK